MWKKVKTSSDQMYLIWHIWEKNPTGNPKKKKKLVKLFSEINCHCRRKCFRKLGHGWQGRPVSKGSLIDLLSKGIPRDAWLSWKEFGFFFKAWSRFYISLAPVLAGWCHKFSYNFLGLLCLYALLLYPDVFRIVIM